MLVWAVESGEWREGLGAPGAGVLPAPGEAVQVTVSSESPATAGCGMLVRRRRIGDADQLNAMPLLLLSGCIVTAC